MTALTPQLIRGLELASAGKRPWPKVRQRLAALGLIKNQNGDTRLTEVGRRELEGLAYEHQCAVDAEARGAAQKTLG